MPRWLPPLCALFGRGLAAEADDGVVVVAVGGRSVAAGGVVGVALGVFLGCARPAVAVAPERHIVDVAEAAGRLLASLGGRLLSGGRRGGGGGARVLRVSAGARLGLAGRRRRGRAGGVFVLALLLALECGGGFPVAKRAGGDTQLGSVSLLGHSLGEQLRRPPLLSGSLPSAAAPAAIVVGAHGVGRWVRGS